MTDQNFAIIDAPFAPLLMASEVAKGVGKEQVAGDTRIWQVEHLAVAIKGITGVLDVGIFCGPDGPTALKKVGRGGAKPVAAYFGMQDGTVQVRTAASF